MDVLAIRDSGCAETIVVPSHHGSSHESKRETQDIIGRRRGSCTLLNKADRKENLRAYVVHSFCIPAREHPNNTTYSGHRTPQSAEGTDGRMV